MKNSIKSIVGILLLFLCGSIIGSNPEIKDEVSGNVTISTTPELYPLTYTWVTEYLKLHPEQKISLVKGDASLLQGSGLYFTSELPKSSENNVESWNMVVGRDAVIPVVSSKNPFLFELNSLGISKEKLASGVISEKEQTWSNLLESETSAKLRFYMVSDAAISITLARYFSSDQRNLNLSQLASTEDMLSVLEKDPYAIGFCRMASLLDQRNEQRLSTVALLPLDKNGNGKMDYAEQIYTNWSSFMRGVWIGKYPHQLCTNIYSTAASHPQGNTEVAFLKWVLTDGQEFLRVNGYCDLVQSDRQSKIENLGGIALKPTADAEVSQSNSILLVISAFVITGMLITLLIVYTRRKKPEAAPAEEKVDGYFNEDSVSVPNGMYYDKTHTWVFMEKDGNLKVGIDDFLQHVTGDLTRVKMKCQGDKIKKGENILTLIQNGKHLVVKSPVSGTVIAHNDLLLIDPATLNQSPYTEGWVYEIAPSNWVGEIQVLQMAEAYRAWLKGEFVRVKDFLASALKTGSPEFSPVILQDGGELKDHVLTEFGPEVWEEFQMRILENAS